MGMPFFSGFATFFVLLAIALFFAIRWAVKKGYYYLKIGLWCATFMLLGYSTYFTTLIRSTANPGIDMYNVDNPVSLVGYLSRDQYGDWPILYGPDFQDRAPRVDRGDLYTMGKDQYEVAGKVVGQDWGNTPSAHFFPRMWNGSNERQEVNTYKKFSGMEGDQPTMPENIKYFWSYQTNGMFMRYFFWNSSARQIDLEGLVNVRNATGITGIPFIDNC